MTESLHAVPQPASEADAASTAEAFEAFFDAERVRLLGALIVMTGNRAEAEELLQDAFLKVWERWDQVVAMENPTGYLYRTALNLYRRRLRRASVAMRKSLNLLPDVDELAGVDIRDEAVRLLGNSRPASVRRSSSRLISGTRPRRPDGSWAFTRIRSGS